MNRNVERFCGALLMLGALLLWTAWALMPDAATNDALHIAEAVGAVREKVRLSALLQLLACALLTPGILRAIVNARGLTLAGGILLMLGLQGMAADAVYHQAAHQMTAPDVPLQGVLPALHRMQTEDIKSLIPLLLAFPLGVIVFGWGCARDGWAPKWAPKLAGAALALAVPGAALVRALGSGRQLLFLGCLAAWMVALGGVGWRLLSSPMRKP